MTTDKQRCLSCGVYEGTIHHPGCGIYRIGGKYTGAIKFEPNKDDDTLTYEQTRRINLDPKPAPLDVHSCLETTLQLLKEGYQRRVWEQASNPTHQFTSYVAEDAPENFLEAWQRLDRLKGFL